MLESEQNSDIVSEVGQVSDRNSESTQHSSGTRKLQRVSKAPEDVRTAKLAALDRNRSSSSSVIKLRKPEEFVGVTLADGRYKVKSQLGKGSMAYVFLAADCRLETDVVIKVPKPEIFTTKDFRERFKRETQLLVKFSHEFENLPYVVMQLLSGGSLADQMNAHCNDKGQMELDSLKQWLPGVSRALDFCARKGMVHRDVKPANILFDEDGNAFVADFGLSKVMYGDHADANSSETAAGIVLGTPNYISPEIVLAKEYDGRADQYSLGISVYHTLLGKPPMQGNSATATMVNQTQKHLQLLSEIRSDVSERLALVIRKSIEKTPGKRFDSCEEFSDAVLEALRIPRKNLTIRSVPKETTTAPLPLAPAAPRSSQQLQHSGQSVRKTSSSRSAAQPAPASNDSEWLDIAAPLPPRKAKGQKKTPRSKKKQSSGFSVLGKKVPMPLAVGVGASLVLVTVLTAVSLFSSDADAVASSPVTGAKASRENTKAKQSLSVLGTTSSKTDPGPAKTGKEERTANGKNRNRNNTDNVQASGVLGTNLWRWKENDDKDKAAKGQGGFEVLIKALPEGVDGNPEELQVAVKALEGARIWAQVMIKGADFAASSQFADPAAALTKQDLDKLLIEFDYRIPDNIEFTVSLQAGPQGVVWSDRNLKLTDMIHGPDSGEGHLVINVFEVDDELKSKFLESMNSDATQSHFFVKLGVQGRVIKAVPDCEFSIRNLRIVARP
jgi:serine/threonine protein kinase